MMKKWGAVFLSALLLIGAFSILPIHGEAQIYDNVIRLHVRANSNSDEDQSLKLLVRDAVLAYTEPLLAGVQSKDEAEAVLRSALPELEEISRQTLCANGSNAPVCVSLERESYPRRTYEAIALPAGEYLSLLVQIDEAEGENWWCVLFPPLCLSAASVDAEATCLSAGLTQEQYRLIADTEDTKYQLRFKILEVAAQILD